MHRRATLLRRRTRWRGCHWRGSAARWPPRGRKSNTLSTSLTQGPSKAVGAKLNPDGITGPALTMKMPWTYCLE
eukprot:12418125-Alexandrium_andersonii.AAC.1